MAMGLFQILKEAFTAVPTFDDLNDEFYDGLEEVLILADVGADTAADTVFGMIVGAAFAHNFGLAGNADAVNEAKEIVVGGISNNGKVAVCLGILIMLGVSLWNMPKAVSAPVEAAK